MRDLNHPKVKPFTRDIASQLRLDQTFVNFVFAKERPDRFRYRVEDVKGSWTCYIPDDVTVAYPLWSTNADQTLLLLSGSKISYGKGWHDNPDMEMISQTSQGLLANLLNSIWESEASEAEMREAAEFCGFRYLSDLLEFANTPALGSVEWEQRWGQFVSAIDAKSIYKRMKLTGAAILVSRGIKVLEAAPAAYPYRWAAQLNPKSCCPPPSLILCVMARRSPRKSEQKTEKGTFYFITKSRMSPFQSAA